MKLPSFVSRSKSNPVLSINFLVLLNSSVMGFQSITGISSARDKEFIQEGGVNDYPIPLKVSKKEPYRITFKRGYVIRKVSVASIAQKSGILTANPFDDIDAWKNEATGLILVLGSNREVQVIYGFASEGMLEWSLSDLDANSSNQLIETFTITHRGLKNIPIPSLSLF